MKINLNTNILNLKGEPIIVEEPNRNASNKVLQQLVSFSVSDATALKNQVVKWQDELKNGIKKEQTARDYFLILLGSRFDLEDKRREVFWVNDLGILFADSKNKEVDISKEKLTFLRKIVERNIIKQLLPMGGEKEIELFFPFETGQLLKVLDGEKLTSLKK